MAKFSSVTAYLSAHPAATRRTLQAMRRAIKAALPRAEEVIAYDMPTYKIDDTAVIYFAAWKAHIAVYPAYADMIAKFARELAPYTVTKGTIKFPLDDVPVALIGKLAKFLAARER